MLKLESQVAELLRTYAGATGTLLSIGTAESASGGRIADRITNVAGSSDYYRGSVVSYSNEVKTGLLGVKASTLARHGAVSPETAMEMALGGRRLLKVDVCISDTGIAGPGGAAQGKPVGLFYMGLAADDTSLSRRHVFHGDREKNKGLATSAALEMFRDYLKGRLQKARSAQRDLAETHVVTSFLEHDGKVLILRRSGRVGSYRGRWSGVSGYLERDPEAQALLEIREETGLESEALALDRKGELLEVVDRSQARKWIVHPFLFRVSSPESIRLDWENLESRWIEPSELGSYETVPGLQEALARVLPSPA